jgi:helix-turn-helix protein
LNIMVFMYLYNRALDEIEEKILVLIVLGVESDFIIRCGACHR